MGLESKEHGGKRTRFPCLVTVRYMVAAVVSVLTVVVVGMVVTIALRPQKVVFSILRQHVYADTLWSSVTTKTTTVPAELSAGFRGRAGSLPSSSNPQQQVVTKPTYSAAAKISLGVSLTAENPDGRGDIEDINNITIIVLDLPSSFSFKGLTEIHSFQLQEHFPLIRQSSHTLWTTATVNDAAVLSYITRRYGGLRSFVAMVQVNATIVSGTPVMTRPKVVTHYCWPVIVGMDEPGDVAKTTPCRPSEEMESPVSYSQLPAQGPGPAPTVAPAA